MYHPIKKKWCFVKPDEIVTLIKKHYSHKIKPTTFNEFKQAINSLLEFASTSALSKNEKLADGYFKIKSKRLKKKLAA